MKPKKSLGQNFLRDKSVVEKIIQSASLKPDDLVIEIGPGEGVLTEELAKHAGKVIAIEIDEALSHLLRNKLRNKKNVEIISDDILKINLSEIINCHSEQIPPWREKSKNLINNSLDPSTSLGMTCCKYKVIANLPYYITSPIIRLFLEVEIPPSEMILMVQKEVAERIVASPSEIPAEGRGAKRISRGKPGKMSILAVSVQYYARPELLFYVSKNSFYPVPEVDSAVIRITHSPKPGTRNPDEVKKFFRLVRAGFSAKRKLLVNNLANSFHLDKKEVEDKLKKAGISPTVRAQELSVEEWKRLSEIII